MIKKDSFLKMAALLKIDTATATAAYDNKEEVDLPVTDGLNIFTADELTQRETTVKATSIKAGTEIAIKELKEKAGLTYDGEGSKDPARFITELTNKAVTEAKIPTDKKVAELTTVTEQLRAKLVESQTAAAAKDGEIRATKNDATMLMHTIALKPDNYSPEEWLGLLKTGITIDEVDGQTVVKRGGEVVKDNLLKPVPVDKALAGFVTEKKWGREPAAGGGGRGGDDTKNKGGGLPVDKAGITNMTQLTAYCQQKGMDIKGQEAQALLNEVAGANKEFDFSK